MRILTKWNNLKIGKRLFAGFGAMLVLLGGLSALSVSSIRELTESFHASSEIASDAQLVTDVATSITRLRLETAEFAASGSSSDAEDVLKTYAAFDALVEKARGEIHQQQRAAWMREIVEVRRRYLEGFEQVRALTARRDTLVAETLDPLGVAMRKKLSDISAGAEADKDYESAHHAGAAQEDLLLARLYIARFLWSGSAKDAERVAAEFKELDTALGTLGAGLASPVRKALLAEVQSELPRFKVAFAELAKTLAERDAVRKGVLAQVGELVSTKVEAIRASAVADAERLDTTVKTDASNIIIEVMVIAGVAIALGLGLAYLIGRGITVPIGGMLEAMKRLSQGHTATEIPARDRHDEIGAMAEAVDVFKQKMIEADRLRADQVEADKRAAEEKKAAMSNLADQLEAAVGGVVKALGAAAAQMQASAQAMSSTAEETSRQAAAVSAASEEATSNVQTVASATEELSASVSEIGRQVATSTRISSKAVEEAAKTDQTVGSLAGSAQKIGEVLDLISDIAAQTNLLALNATIEAARAGEAGKGFAVVASEVKNLASQTAKATEDISAQVNEIRGATQNAVSAIKEIGGTINEMSRIATTIASAVEEQGAATQEIARNVQEASKGTTEVSSNIAGVSQAAGQTGAAAGEVLSTAGALAKQSETLRHEVERFLRTIRAA